MNLAPFILLPIEGDSFSAVSLLFTSIHQWILSSDKLAVLRGIYACACMRGAIVCVHKPLQLKCADNAYFMTLQPGGDSLIAYLYTLCTVLSFMHRSGDTWRAYLVHA